jgi:hypothetical protein
MDNPVLSLVSLFKAIIKQSDNNCNIFTTQMSPFLRQLSSFSGLVVNMLASGTQDRGIAPGRSRWIFSGEKILSMPSFGREVKSFAPCRRFAACQRTL